MKKKIISTILISMVMTIGLMSPITANACGGHIKTVKMVTYPGYLMDVSRVNIYDKNVLLAQRALCDISSTEGRVFYVNPDGYYGEKTKAAIEAFQAYHRDLGLKKDGILGPETWKVLYAHKFNNYWEYKDYINS